MLPGELDISGVFVPSLLVLALLAFAITLVARRLLGPLHVERYVWHRALFDVALYVIILGTTAALLQ